MEEEVPDYEIVYRGSPESVIMKFDVPGWNRGRYIGCITDPLFNHTIEPRLPKYLYCPNSQCLKYIERFKIHNTMEVFELGSCRCQGCGCELVYTERLSDIPVRIPHFRKKSHRI